MADKIILENGHLTVSNNPIIPFIEGDGVGRDIWKNARAVFDAAIDKATKVRKKLNGLSFWLVKKRMKQQENGYQKQLLKRLKKIWSLSKVR